MLILKKMQFQDLEQVKPTLTKDETNALLASMVMPELRKEVCLHVCTRPSDDDYFFLDNFYKKYNLQGTAVSKTLTTQIVKELEDIGWVPKIVFGGTSMYILRPNQDRKHISAYFDEILE